MFIAEVSVKEKMKRKFEICYVLAREGIAFLKYLTFHALAESQGVNIGSSYQGADCAKTFTHFIAESQRQAFLPVMSTTKIFSFLMDGSTDAGNTEVELVLVLYCTKDDVAREIRSCTRYLAVVSPTHSNAGGLIDCLGQALRRLGLEDIRDREQVLGRTGPVLVGGGTDGASVNIGVHNGMKGQLQSAQPWLHWAWCYSHRLELACKDALKSPLFANINEMLLRLYYLYNKSPKKSQELTTIVEELKEVYHFPKGGSLPVRCQGTRWINYKRKAMQRVIDRFGAYISHLAALIEDSSVKACDKARLKGYVQWNQGKILVGCAMYIEILKAPSILSLALQEDQIDIVYGLKQILKSASALQSLAQREPKNWPTVKLVVGRVSDEGGQKFYQGGVLKNFTDDMFTACSRQALSDLQKLDSKMRERLEWTDVKLLRSILVFLDTCSWAVGASSDTSEEMADDMADIRAAVEHIITVFRKPLEAKGACLSSLDDELEEVVQFCRRYLDSQLEDYRKVWFKLHSTHDSRKWPTVLLLSELLFSLPFTNSKVERMFSSLKVIKTDRRTSLQITTLDDLMESNVEGPSPESFSAEQAVNLWWSDRSRRPNETPRNKYKPREGQTEADISDDQDTAEQEFTLNDWDEWFATDD